MPWKTKKQRKHTKVKSKIKKSVIILLILFALVAVGMGAMHSNKSTIDQTVITDTENSTHMLKSSESETDDISTHYFSISIDGRGLKINW